LYRANLKEDSCACVAASGIRARARARVYVSTRADIGRRKFFFWFSGILSAAT
jgi:hypothetical protein